MDERGSEGDSCTAYVYAYRDHPVYILDVFFRVLVKTKLQKL